ncbi:MAG: hypothetical protein GC168_21470 [Candidatus Hydrogenedens sp.]|nr:hypothetical protein [Candidatus Hydrogenedens sp.]
MKNPPWVYVDTSVFGGVFDDEFAEASRAFFEQAVSGSLRIAVSPLSMDELDGAPQQIRSYFDNLADFVSPLEIDASAYDLQQAYLNAGVVSPKWEIDALHVAIASVNSCNAIVSWNFKHIVNFRRIPLYNEVNLERGYKLIAIHSPAEFVADGED